MFRLEKRVAEMCNLSEGIERCGEKIGQERGEKTGRKAFSVLLQKLIQEGRKEEGIASCRTMNIRNNCCGNII